MGFKCPVCFQDFKKDITEWKRHCLEKHNGIAAGLVKLVNDIGRKTEEAIQKQKEDTKDG